MADTEQTQGLKDAFNRMIDAEISRVQAEHHREQALMAWRSGRPMTRRGMLRVLEAEDERLTDLLIDLGAAVKSWWRFDDRETSAVHGVLQQHKRANRRLVGAVFDLIDAVTEQDGDPAAQPEDATAETQTPGPISQDAVLQLLKREDEHLISVLSVLHRRLQAWVPFDDHDSSEQQGVLDEHADAERDLAVVLCDVVAGLTAKAGGAA